MAKYSKKTPAKNIDDYLALVPKEFRVALEKLRQTIKSAAPDAVETISYQIPTFKLDGRMLVSFAAFAEHCSFFPGAGPIDVHEKELKAFTTSKGTIRFTPDRPLSPALIKKLVKTRMKLDEAAQKTRQRKTR